MQRLKRYYGVFRRIYRAFSRKERALSILLVSLFVFSSYRVSAKVVQMIPGIPAASEQTVTNGVYKEALVGSVRLLNPLFVDFNSVDRDISSLIFSGLTRYNPVTKTFEGDLADYTISKDGKTYTFTLKPNVIWHDGTPFTADDVLFTYKDVIQNEAFPNTVLRDSFADITIEKTEEGAIQFTLTEPNYFFLSTTNIGILPKHVFSETAPADIVKHPFNKEPIGTGPYALVGPPKTINSTTEVELAAFSDYYAEKPSIESIRFEVFSTGQELIDGIAQVHGISKVSLREAQEIMKKDERFTTIEYALPQFNAVFFNLSSPIMKSATLRLALLRVIDRDRIATAVDGVESITSPLLQLDHSEIALERDLSKARTSLYNAGWLLPKEIPEVTDENFWNIPFNEIQKENFVRKGKTSEKPLKLTLIAQAFHQGSRAQIEQDALIDTLKKQWLLLGVEIDDQYLIGPDYQARIKQRDYDLLLAKQHLGYNSDLYSYWHSSQASENGLNFSHYKSFGADSIIEDIRTIDPANEEKLTKRLKDLRKVITDDYPALFLYQPQHAFVVDKKFAGMTFSNFGYTTDRFANVEKWYITDTR